MSDYLANIAQRSLATEQAIRPRPLSVFEPLQATGVVDFPQQPQAEENYRITDSGASGMDSISPMRMTTKEHPVGQSGGQTLSVQAPRLNVSIKMPEPQPAAPQRLERPSGQGNYGPVVPPFPPEPGVLIDDRVSPVLERRGDSAVESPEKHRTASNPRSSAPEQEFRSTAHISVVSERLSGTAETIPKGILLKPAVTRSERGQPVKVQLPGQPFAPLPWRFEMILAEKKQSLPNEISPPTINVTIGRIEVRATPAPDKHTPKPKRQGPMGLEEYLRKRNGGER